ncbi:MAG: DEAD/DEAH box helicase [Anaerolineae bacterium]|nr:DEAD/DEAH box helicase [Anaerolineae bacterium]
MDDLTSLIAYIRADPAFMRCVAAWERLPARPARTVAWPADLDPRLVDVARRLGIDAPYTHQAEAMGAALEGRNVVQATPAASGKSLAYNLPVLDTLLNDPAACALYLFPTKALAHDQLAALEPLIAALQAPIALRPYDGDTPSSHRRAIRNEARLVVSNPDMLHAGMLPYHTRWARFFSNLRWVVLDELHVYRGVFGSHVANVLRRLRRVCRFYGADPRFLCASATIANPQALAERLVEAPVQAVVDDGSPHGEKHFVIYNPPLLDRELGIRRSSLLAAVDLSEHLLRRDVQTILFARARLTTEVLLGYLQDLARAQGSDPARVRGYRGGYLPTQRREIEQGLRAGAVRMVVATNALELGIDIGALTACVMVGYPGSVASTWQQAGRAGRRAGQSLAVLIASPLPLDQYLAAHPRYFFERPVEEALLDPDNLALLLDHLACAAYELPFEAGEPFGAFGDVGALLDLLVDEGVLHRTNGRVTWIGEEYPARAVGLRAGGPDTVVIQDVAADPPQVIGQIDRPSAPTLVHPGAVYLHEAETYLVEELDWERGLAQVRARELDYYTRASATTAVRVLETTVAREETGWVAHAGELEVISRATGYRQIRRYTHEVLGWGEIDLPEQTLQTVGAWLDLSEALVEQMQAQGVLRPRTDYGPDWPAQRDAARARDGYRCRHCNAPEREQRQHDVHHVTPFLTFGYVPGRNEAYRQANALENLVTLCAACHRQAERAHGARSALSGLAYVLRHLAPLYLLCAPGDMGSVVEARAAETGRPRVTFYDQVRGGAGLSARLYDLFGPLLAASLERVRSCPCSDGCPACVGPAGEQEPGTKQSTERLLAAMCSQPMDEHAVGVGGLETRPTSDKEAEQ